MFVAENLDLEADEYNRTSEWFATEKHSNRNKQKSSRAF